MEARRLLSVTTPTTHYDPPNSAEQAAYRAAVRRLRTTDTRPDYVQSATANGIAQALHETAQTMEPNKAHNHPADDPKALIAATHAKYPWTATQEQDATQHAAHAYATYSFGDPNAAQVVAALASAVFRRATPEDRENYSNPDDNSSADAMFVSDSHTAPTPEGNDAVIFVLHADEAGGARIDVFGGENGLVGYFDWNPGA